MSQENYDELIEKLYKKPEEKINDEDIVYNCCDRFYGKEKLVCDNIKKLYNWVINRDGLNMKDVINKILGEVRTCEDMNQKYQLPLSYLFKKNVEGVTKNDDGTYYSNKLTDCCLVKDKNDGWSYVNKLNSNYSDISELLTTLFLKGDKIDMLSKMNTTEIKKYLLSLKKNNVLYKLLKKYFDISEYSDYTYNSRNNTKVGDEIELMVKELLEKNGYNAVYQGSEGDFIDMLYGIDLIMEKKDTVFLVQVKSKPWKAKESTKNTYYRYIDIFASESEDCNGINLYYRINGFKEIFLAKDVLSKNMEFLKKKIN